MSERRTGTTTRFADDIIQLLFDGQEVIVRYEEDRYRDRRLFDVVVNRLRSEHNHLIENNILFINEQTLTIKLKQ